MSERPTPRTDKAEYEVRLGRHRRMVVRPELARELERELAEAREELESYAWTVPPAMAEAKIAQLELELEREKRRAESLAVLAHDLGIQLAEARERRDRLAQVIEAATVLIAAKGRHNTFLAYEGLREALDSVKDSGNETSPSVGDTEKL